MFKKMLLFLTAAVLCLSQAAQLRMEVDPADAPLPIGDAPSPTSYQVPSPTEYGFWGGYYGGFNNWWWWW